mgnify:CR=1 FL=1|jgi:hypothetical protein
MRYAKLREEFGMDDNIPEEYSTAIFSEFAKQRRILDKYTKKNLKHGLAYSIQLVYTGEIAVEIINPEDLFDSLKVKTDESDCENEEKCENMLKTIGFQNITFSRLYPECFKFTILSFSEKMRSEVEKFDNMHVAPFLAYYNYRRYKTHPPWYTVYEIYEKYNDQ